MEKMDKAKKYSGTRSKPKILIAGLSRDGEKVIRDNLGVLREAFGHDYDAKYLVIESDSSDRTCERLQELSEECNDTRFISHGDLGSALKTRTERIAYCRNSYIYELERNVLYKDCELLVVADLDGVNSLLSRDSVVSSIKECSDWDACTAVQAGPYYDLFALRKKGWVETDVWNDVKTMRKRLVPRIIAEFICVYSKMKKMSYKKGCRRFVEVESAFGGLAVYKVSVVKGCRYHGLDAEGKSVCEHLSFNEGVRKNGGRIVIDRRLTNSSLNEHSQAATLKGLIRLAKTYYVEPLKRRLQGIIAEI